MSASADISVKQIDDFEVDVGLDDIRVKELPAIRIGTGADQLTIGTGNGQIKLGKIEAALDELKIRKLEAKLDPIAVAIKEIPKLLVGIDPLTVNLGPIDLNLSIKEIPSVRVHLPLHFGLGLSVLGHEVISARVAGEAQVITEPYEPNACETCSHDKLGKGKP